MGKVKIRLKFVTSNGTEFRDKVTADYYQEYVDFYNYLMSIDPEKFPGGKDRLKDFQYELYLAHASMAMSFRPKWKQEIPIAGHKFQATTPEAEAPILAARVRELKAKI